MSRRITQYRIFIASPGGLSDERKVFRDAITELNKNFGEPEGVIFEPVGWEDTLGGIGRPQELINEDLHKCDYAIFVFHDRWGTPTGNGKTSGTQEEWEIAQELYERKIVRKICLFFKSLDGKTLSTIDDQLKQVLKFRDEIVASKKHLFHQFSTVNDFQDTLKRHLSTWLRDHLKAREPDLSSSAPAAGPAALPIASDQKMEHKGPSTAYWITEAAELLEGTPTDDQVNGGFFCANKALALAATDGERWLAQHSLGLAYYFRQQYSQAIDAFDQILSQNKSESAHSKVLTANTLINKAMCFRALDRTEDVFETYGKVIAKFNNDEDPYLKHRVAKAKFGTAALLGDQGKVEQSIEQYNEVVRDFTGMKEIVFQEAVARSLNNMAIQTVKLGDHHGALKIYEDMIDRFKNASELTLRESVARAVFGKGRQLQELNENDAALEVFDEAIKAYANSDDFLLVTQAAKALLNKGLLLEKIDPHKAISTYEEFESNFGRYKDELEEQFVGTLFNKALVFDKLALPEKEIETYDEIFAKFGTSSKRATRLVLARSLNNKAITLSAEGRHEEAAITYGEVVDKFRDASELDFKEQVAKAKYGKATALIKNKKLENGKILLAEFIEEYSSDGNPQILSWTEDAMEALQILRGS